MPTEEEKHRAYDTYLAMNMLAKEAKIEAFSLVHGTLLFLAETALIDCGWTEAQLLAKLQDWIDFVRADQGKGPTPN